MSKKDSFSLKQGELVFMNMSDVKIKISKRADKRSIYT